MHHQWYMLLKHGILWLCREEPTEPYTYLQIDPPKREAKLQWNMSSFLFRTNYLLHFPSFSPSNMHDWCINLQSHKCSGLSLIISMINPNGLVSMTRADFVGFFFFFFIIYLDIAVVIIRPQFILFSCWI